MHIHSTQRRLAAVNNNKKIKIIERKKEKKHTKPNQTKSKIKILNTEKITNAHHRRRYKKTTTHVRTEKRDCVTRLLHTQLTAMAEKLNRFSCCTRYFVFVVVGVYIGG